VPCAVPCCGPEESEEPLCEQQLFPRLVRQGYRIGRPIPRADPTSLLSMSRRRLLTVLGAVAVIAVVVIGLAQSGGSTKAPKPDSFDLAAARAKLAGAPAPLAALHADANRLIPTSKAKFSGVLDGLKGHPVVINKWASWCAPCRGEFPVLQATSVAYGKRVAFVGLDSKDSDADAATFLRHFPVPYPSYVDRDARVAQGLEIGQFYPTTMFYDAGGKMQYIHQGPYTSDDAFAADIQRYALGEPQ
jgi:cytochrome c biogenesis protein CcmG/thiol:disulfide interchange protein DsbE